jgi:hypothetical protein
MLTLQFTFGIQGVRSVLSWMSLLRVSWDSFTWVPVIDAYANSKFKCQAEVFKGIEKVTC